MYHRHNRIPIGMVLAGAIPLIGVIFIMALHYYVNSQQYPFATTPQRLEPFGQTPIVLRLVGEADSLVIKSNRAAQVEITLHYNEPFTAEGDLSVVSEPPSKNLTNYTQRISLGTHWVSQEKPIVIRMADLKGRPLLYGAVAIRSQSSLPTEVVLSWTPGFPVPNAR